MMANLLVDLLLPTTDQAVRNQWIAMAVFWAAVFVLARRLMSRRPWGKDVLLLLIGLATVNLAWFAVRAVH